MPRLATNPVTAAVVLFKVWRRLPPHHRRLLLEAARRHGPAVARGAALASWRVVASRRRA